MEAQIKENLEKEMSIQLPNFASKYITGARFVSSPESKRARVLVDRHSQAMNKWRKESGFTEDTKVISWLLRQTD